MYYLAVGAMFMFSMLGVVSVQAQISIFQHWKGQGTPSITVETDWDSLYAVRDESYRAATLLEGDDTWDIEVRLRGVSRRRDCFYKPFQVNFKKKELRAKGYADFDKMKVVTQCIEDDAGQENVYEELLVYQLYQLITDESFSAVPCNLTYKWPGNKQKAITTVGLLLEPNNECFERLGGEEVEKYNMPPDSLEPLSYLHTAVFQFMIGNTDWSHAFTRNVKMLRQDGLLTLIPYDFDYSAIVSPPYARISPDFAVQDFKDRVYLGAYFFEMLPQVLDEFRSRKAAILQHVDEYPYLKSGRKRWIKGYIEDFFTFIDDEETQLQYQTILPFKP